MDSGRQVEVVKALSRVVEISPFQVASRRIALIAASAFFFATVPAQAQQAQTAPEGRVIVTGEGDVAVAPFFFHRASIGLVKQAQAAAFF